MRRCEILRGRASFERLFAFGRRLDGDLFRCLWLRNETGKGSVSVAFAVPGRLMNAVRRNRVRRLMRAAFARERETFTNLLYHQGIGLWIFFLFRPRSRVDLRRLSLADIYPDIAALCRTVRMNLQDQTR